MKHSELINRAVAWLENHDNPNIAIYNTKNTREIISACESRLRELNARLKESEERAEEYYELNEQLLARHNELEDKVAELEAKLANLKTLVAKQKTGVEVWFDDKYATEAYSRIALRRLHKVIEEMKP